MTAQPPDEQPPAKIDWPAVFAGAGAAVTVAVLLSTLGAAGTLMGAALGSVIATVSTALYKQALQSSRRKVAEVQASALLRVGLAQQEVRRAAAHSDSSTVASDLARADAHLDVASSGLAENGEGEDAGPEDAEERHAEAGDGAAPTQELVVPPADPAPKLGWATLPWRRIALFAVVAFLVAMLAITIFEVLAGRSVGSLTGGSHDKRTSISGLLGDSTDSGSSNQSPEPSTTGPTSSSATASTSSTPSTGPTSTSTSPSATASDSASASAQPTGSVAPSEAPSTPASDLGTVTGTALP